jgi:hypothetical protein
MENIKVDFNAVGQYLRREDADPDVVRFIQVTTIAGSNFNYKAKKLLKCSAFNTRMTREFISTELTKAMNADNLYDSFYTAIVRDYPNIANEMEKNPDLDFIENPDIFKDFLFNYCSTEAYEWCTNNIKF